MSNQTEEQKLDPSFKKRWLAALRSGDYRQCRRMLRGTRGGFCCMGVALDVKDPKGWAKEASYIDDDVSQKGFDWKHLESGEAGGSLGEVLGIKGSICRELAEFNDEGRHTFKWIANWIEANL